LCVAKKFRVGKELTNILVELEITEQKDAEVESNVKYCCRPEINGNKRKEATQKASWFVFARLRKNEMYC